MREVGFPGRTGPLFESMEGPLSRGIGTPRSLRVKEAECLFPLLPASHPSSRG